MDARIRQSREVLDTLQLRLDVRDLLEAKKLGPKVLSPSASRRHSLKRTPSILLRCYRIISMEGHGAADNVRRVYSPYHYVLSDEIFSIRIRGAYHLATRELYRTSWYSH